MNRDQTFPTRTTNPEDRFVEHLIDAHENTQRALDLLYEPEGPKRKFWYRWTLGRAQSILISLLVKELNRESREAHE